MSYGWWCPVLCLQKKKSRDMNGGYYHYPLTLADMRVRNQAAHEMPCRVNPLK
jgi:hypothetical protein